jgi:hypothetical protein
LWIFAGRSHFALRNRKTERTSHFVGLWIGAATSNTSHSNKAGSTTVKRARLKVKDQDRRQCCHNKQRNFPIGLHVMYFYSPDTPRIMIQYLYSYVNYPAYNSHIFFRYVIACVAMPQSLKLSCKWHDFQKKCLKQKWTFNILQILSEIYLLQKELSTIINILKSSNKSLIFLSDINRS